MKYQKAAVAVWIGCVTFIISIMSDMKSTEIHTRTFCAYNRVFVEFEEGKKTWGTIMLDTRGKPIPCSEGDDPEAVTQDSTSI